MLQQTEYRTKYYLKWLWQTRDFSNIQKRGSLDMTGPARLLLVIARLLVAIVLLSVGYLLWQGIFIDQNTYQVFIGVFLLFTFPVVVAHLILVPTWLGRFLIIQPMRTRQGIIAKGILEKHNVIKIAVAGSYGKTTMKQILATVISEGKKVGYTKGNFNTAVAHYRFAKGLTGKEQVLIVEYGEYIPGDVAEFNSVVQPDIGVITGLNEAHLENFDSLEHSAENILSLASYVGDKNVYINGNSSKLLMFCPYEAPLYTHEAIGKWKISEIKVTKQGTKFTMRNGRRSLRIDSQLLGKHNVGPLAVAAVIADRLGLNKKQIEAGMKRIVPYDHRMQPSKRKGNVYVIDDTYNGNIDSVMAGVELLATLRGKRKIYVTPGLVEQGKQTKAIHIQLGELIAPVCDVVVLMRNSVTRHIKAGLEKANFKGKLIEVDEPVKFYQNLDQITASGDVVLMQNDWSDAYR